MATDEAKESLLNKEDESALAKTWARQNRQSDQIYARQGFRHAHYEEQGHDLDHLSFQTRPSQAGGAFACRKVTRIQRFLGQRRGSILCQVASRI